MKYIEEYLEEVLHIKPLGVITFGEPSDQGGWEEKSVGVQILVDGNETGINVWYADYAMWLENKLDKAKDNLGKDYLRLEDNSITALCRIYNEVLSKNPERAIITSAPWADFVREVKEKFNKIEERNEALRT